MKYKVFDVVELLNENKATILDVLKNGYRVEIVDKTGVTQGIKEISETDIKNCIVSK